jgi:hypothetical protein
MRSAVVLMINRKSPFLRIKQAARIFTFDFFVNLFSESRTFLALNDVFLNCLWSPNSRLRLLRQIVHTFPDQAIKVN